MQKQELLRSAHPVEPAMRAQVMESLRRIEAEHDVTVLFACESGSRGWGFASPDSDYDVRFIYAHRLPWYLTVAPGRDVIELPINGELDVKGVSGFLCVRRGNESTTSLSLGPCQAAGGAPG